MDQELLETKQIASCIQVLGQAEHCYSKNASEWTPSDSLGNVCTIHMHNLSGLQASVIPFNICIEVAKKFIWIFP